MVIIMKVKENILILQGQEPLFRDKGKTEYEVEVAKADPTDEDSGYLLTKTKE